MASIQKIKGSNGSGNANVATVQSIRSPGSSTIVVDTVLNINSAGFMASMGTPHTFTDPVTSETITVISEASCVDFAGHVNSGHLEIDTIAPGYTDAGSAVGDIVIIRPTTQWADNLAATLAVQHNDDGTHAAVTANSLTVSGTSSFTGAMTIPTHTVTPDKLLLGGASASTTSSGSTTSTSYGTVNDSVTTAVTVTVSANGLALVFIGTQFTNSTNLANTAMAVVASGANTVAAGAKFPIVSGQPVSGQFLQAGSTFLWTGLAAGSTTFTLAYKVDAGTGTWSNRHISVIPL